MPQAILIAKGKNADLIPYLGNSPNKNVLNYNAMNPTCLIDFSSLERALTYLPILANLPPGEAICPPKCLNNFSSTTRSSTESWMLKGLSSPNIGSKKVFTTSSKVIVSSPIKIKKKKKNI